MTSTFGTPGHHLCRPYSPSTSKEAAFKVKSAILEEQVYGAIRSFGSGGCISDDIRSLFPELPYSSITARYSALLRKTLICLTGDKRPGNSGVNQRVMRACA